MAPSLVIEPKDLPPEIEVQIAHSIKPEPVPTIEAHHQEIEHPVVVPDSGATAADWESTLQAEAIDLLASGRTDVWDALSKRFESCLILTALENTRGRRIEAAVKLGIGRNTITRKIQELGLE